MLTENSNNIELISEDNTDLEVVAEDKDITWLRNLSAGMNYYQAGVSAGFSDSYSRTSICNKWKSPKFQQKAKEFFLSEGYAMTPKISKIWQRTIDHLDKCTKAGDFSEMAKLKSIPKQILNTLGFTTPEVVKGGTNIFMAAGAQAMIAAAFNLKLPEPKEGPQEIQGEVVDVPEISNSTPSEDKNLF